MVVTLDEVFLCLLLPKRSNALCPRNLTLGVLQRGNILYTEVGAYTIKMFVSALL